MRRRGQEFWTKLVDEAASGATHAEFAARHGVERATFGMPQIGDRLNIRMNPLVHTALFWLAALVLGCEGRTALGGHSAGSTGSPGAAGQGPGGGAAGTGGLMGSPTGAGGRTGAGAATGGGVQAGAGGGTGRAQGGGGSTGKASGGSGGVVGGSNFAVLPYGVVDAEYSNLVDAIVLASDEPALHIIAPALGSDKSVPLSDPPVAVSVAPTGDYAVVCHGAHVSYVRLSDGVLLQTFPVSATCGDIVMTGNGYAYLFPAYSVQRGVHSINLSTGEESLGGWEVNGSTQAKVNHEGTALYAADRDLSPDTLFRYDIDIATGVALEPTFAPDPGKYHICSNLWLSLAGDRIFTACGNMFRASEIPTFDMTFAGQLDVSSVASVADSGSQVAVIAGTASIWADDTLVHFYDEEYLAAIKTAALPNFPTTKTTPCVSHGKFVFFDRSGTRVFVIVRADAASAILHDFAIVTLG